MKKLHLLAVLCIATLIFTSCQKDEILEIPSDVIIGNLEKAPGKKHPVPFHATYTSAVVSVSPNSDVCGSGLPVLNFVATGSGNATHMGNITTDVSSCLIPNVIILGGTLTVTAANGDKLVFEQSPPGSSILEVIDGTGRFEDATGTVEGSFEIIGPGVFANTLEGEIQY